MLDTARMSADQAAHYLARKILSNGGKNTKLGEGVYAFSLPHGKEQSCPDATALCQSICYVDNYLPRRPAIRDSYRRNFELAKRHDFRQILKLTLSRLPACLFRIHVSGDFFSVRYIRDWTAALQANPHIRPFGFTRAWRDPRKRRALEDGGLHSFILASVDDETGPAPDGWRTAQMRTDIRIRSLLAGKTPIPQMLCNEQHPKLRDTCAACGRCPGVKLGVNGGVQAFIPLKPTVFRTGVVFAEH